MQPIDINNLIESYNEKRPLIINDVLILIVNYATYQSITKKMHIFELGDGGQIKLIEKLN